MRLKCPVKYCLFFALAIIMAISLSFSSFSEVKATIDPVDIGVGTRALGMGKAYVAVANDPSCIYYNPAGLSLVNNWGVNTMYSSILSEINFNSLAVYRSSSMEGIGFGFVGANVGGNIYTSYIDPATNRIVPLDVIASGYTSDVFIFSYGVLLGKYLDLPLSDRISLGLSVKAFKQELRATDEATASGYDLDVGLIYRANSWLNVGFYGQNILPVESGGVLRWNTGVEESIPSAYKLGVSTKILGEEAILPHEQDLFLNMDVEGSAVRTRPVVYHAGLEWWPAKFMSIRTGIDQDVYAIDSSNGVDNNLTLGLGLWYGEFGFDYAYHQYGSLTDNATHYFSISYGNPRAEAVVPQKETPIETKDEIIKSDQLAIASPADKSATYKSSIVVNGDILDANVAKITVNEKEAKIIEVLEAKRVFNAEVPLNAPGKYLIKVGTFDKDGNLLKEYRVRLLGELSG